MSSISIMCNKRSGGNNLAAALRFCYDRPVLIDPLEGDIDAKIPREIFKSALKKIDMSATDWYRIIAHLPFYKLNPPNATEILRRYFDAIHEYYPDLVAQKNSGCFSHMPEIVRPSCGVDLYLNRYFLPHSSALSGCHSFQASVSCVDSFDDLDDGCAMAKEVISLLWQHIPSQVLYALYIWLIHGYYMMTSYQDCSFWLEEIDNDPAPVSNFIRLALGREPGPYLLEEEIQQPSAWSAFHRRGIDDGKRDWFALNSYKQPTQWRFENDAVNGLDHATVKSVNLIQDKIDSLEYPMNLLADKIIPGGI